MYGHGIWAGIVYRRAWVTHGGDGTRGMAFVRMVRCTHDLNGASRCLCMKCILRSVRVAEEAHLHAWKIQVQQLILTVSMPWQ